MGRTFDTRIIAKLVSEIAGQAVEVKWFNSRDMPPGTIGAANWRLIMLDEGLARRSDPQLPSVILHEMAHVLLHKRVSDGDKALKFSDEEAEREAERFSEHMQLVLGDDFIWRALTGELDYSEMQDGKAKITTFSDLPIFKRNRPMAEPYQRSSQPDVQAHSRRQGGYMQSTKRSQQEQGQYELSLARKYESTSPQIAAMIRHSAQEKLGTGLPSSNSRNSGSNYQQFERATQYR